VQQLLDVWNVYGVFEHGYAAIVSPITNLLRGKDPAILCGNALQAAFQKITILFTSGKTPLLRHYNPNRPALVETDASDFAIAGILSQKFDDGKLHPVSFISTKLSPAELNYNVFVKEIIAIAFSLQNGGTFSKEWSIGE